MMTTIFANEIAAGIRCTIGERSLSFFFPRLEV
jgi:hypothetical protein